MKLHIFLEFDKEKVTNLAIANALMQLCEDLTIDLDPDVIAKAILVQVEATSLEAKAFQKMADAVLDKTNKYEVLHHHELRDRLTEVAQELIKQRGEPQ